MFDPQNITKAVIGCAIALIGFAAPAYASSFFDEWRYPSERDITGDWQDSRQEGREFYTFTADFNGDGERDEAWILIKKDDSEWGLFVFLSTEDGEWRIIELVRYKMTEMIPQGMGIWPAPPGSYETACGKGYYKCDRNEPEAIKLKNPAIDFFRFQSANSFFVWDRDSDEFERIWISD